MSEITKKDEEKNILDTPFPNIVGSGVMLIKHSQKELNKMFQKEAQTRLKLICDRDNINFNLLNAEFLKYLFAKEPALKTKPKKRGAGQPPRWQGHDGYKLFVAVDNYQRRNKGQSALSACKYLVNNEFKGDTAKNLERRYHELKKMNPFILWDMTGFNNHINKDIIRKELLILTADIDKK